jgi:hypothetical protein
MFRCSFDSGEQSPVQFVSKPVGGFFRGRKPSREYEIPTVTLAVNARIMKRRTVMPLMEMFFRIISASLLPYGMMKTDDDRVFMTVFHRPGKKSGSASFPGNCRLTLFLTVDANCTNINNTPIPVFVSG